MGDASLAQKAIARVEQDRVVLAEPEVRKLPEVEAVLKAPDEARREAILELASMAAAKGGTARRLLPLVAARKLDLDLDDARTLLTSARDAPGGGRDGDERASAVLKGVLPRLEMASRGWSDEEVEELTPLIEAAAKRASGKTATRLKGLLPAQDDGLPFDLILDGDDFGPRVRALLEASDEDEAVLRALLELLGAHPSQGRPPKKWHAAAGRVREALADPDGLARGLLDALIAAEDIPERKAAKGRSYLGAHFINPGNEHVALGAARFAAGIEEPSLPPRLRRVAVKSAAVLGGPTRLASASRHGEPRSIKLANAAIQALAEAGGRAALSELVQVERAVRHGSILKEAGKAIDALAEAEDVTRDELLERGVEGHDLDADGRREVPLSRGAARVELDARSAALVYVDEEGTARKTFPKAVKEADDETLAALRDELKEMRKTLAGERERIDGLLATDRRWSLEEFEAHYLSHPVTGRLARALIWTFRTEDGDEVAGMPIDARALTTSDGEEAAVPEGAEVGLFHPVAAPEEDVRAWRRRLLGEEIAQPLKQAFRETYAPTPEEADSPDYSNRFAGHVFRQRQARALMKTRGWKAPPVAWWDDGTDHGVASRVFEPAGVRAEFFYDPVLDEEPGEGSDLYPYCTSDQVRFFDAASDAGIELAEVPPLVFSEAMRDVDLFVAVTSVGADPEWLDRGEGRFEEYWTSFAFGELGEAGRVRREVVEALVPRLAIADRLEVEERYLVVRGDLRTYRIHLGSGNVLMSPGEEYLCIVQAGDKRAGKLFLPFDDDPALSLILSKAFMLAEDSDIEDEAIARQISP